MECVEVIMRKTGFISIIIMLMASAIAFAGNPMDTLDDKEIEVNDTKLEVLEKLGAPVMRENVGSAYIVIDGVGQERFIENLYYRIPDRMGKIWICTFSFGKIPVASNSS
jgi:hypothetical protein